MLSKEITVIDGRKTHQRSMIRYIFLSFFIKKVSISHLFILFSCGF